MSRAAMERRLAALEIGSNPTPQTQQEWAARYGWPQIYEWQDLYKRRLFARIAALIAESNGEPVEDEIIPEPDELEVAFHASQERELPPDPGAAEECRARILRACSEHP